MKKAPLKNVAASVHQRLLATLSLRYTQGAIRDVTLREQLVPRLRETAAAIGRRFEGARAAREATRPR